MTVRWLPLLLLVAPGCDGADAEVDGAASVFATFQAALQQGDEGQCRQLLTRESQAALAQIPWRQIASQQPLRVVATRREHPDRSTFLVDIEDPNHGDARGQYVVVREHGRLVVDLVASAGRNAVAVEATGSGPTSEPQYEPRALTPADHERIRRYELSQPREKQPPR